MFDRLESQLIGRALEELREKFGALASVRECLALGLRMLRERSRLEEEEAAMGLEEDPEELEGEEEREVTLAERLESLFRAAAREYLQAKAATKLLNAKILVKAREEWRLISFASGQLNGSQKRLASPWAGLGLADFDRMMVLKSELAKVEHRFCDPA